MSWLCAARLRRALKTIVGDGDGDVNDDDGDDAVVEAVVVVGRAKVR